MDRIAKGEPAGFTDYIVQRRVEILKCINGFMDNEKTLLDIGCGNGASLLLINNYFSSCHGVDISETSLIQLETKIINGKSENITWSLEDIDINFCDWKTFDRIISFEVLEHVVNDQKLLKKMYTKLNPGGVMVITIPNKWWIFETHGAYLPILPWNRVPFFSWLPKFIHSRFAKARIYRKKDVIKLFNNTKFELTSINYVTAPMDVIKWDPLRNLLRRTIFKNHTTPIPFLATAIMVVCKRPD